VGYHEFVFGIAPLWDIDRVEVFRTPQTTTQGRNSIAGAIFIHSRDPTEHWEARGRAIAGDLHSRQLSATASGPLVADQLAVRVSGDWRKSRPASRIADKMRGADPDRDEYGLVRVKLLARPAFLPQARVELTYAHIESQAPQIEGIREPYRERRDRTAGYGLFGTNVDSLTAAIDYEPADGLASRSVVSLGRTDITRFAPAGLGEALISGRDWSAESIVDWRPDPGLRLTGGVSYVRSSLDQRIDLSQLSGIGEFDDSQSGFGLFAEAGWRFSERAELTGGIRYQHDRQERSGALASGSGDILLDYQRSFSAWLPKVSLTYELSDNLLAGVLVQRAYNPGGVSLRFDTGLTDQFDDERLWNYELFARADLGSSLKARVNLFRTDFSNLQRSNFILVRAPSGAIVPFADLFNVAKARSHGAEAELEWQVTPRFHARAALGLLGTKITKSGDAPADLLGKEFQRAPGVTASAALDWRPIEPVRLTAQARHSSGFFSDDSNDRSLRIKDATIVDARVSWTSGRATLFGYVRNMFDTFRLRAMFNSSLAVAHGPRQIGIGIEGRF
jgi:outer membrane receptor protein involved in Fe transport